MLRNVFALTLVAALVLPLVARAAEDKKASEGDKIFVEMAYVNNEFDRQLAELATQKAENPQLKQMAQTIADDHKNAEPRFKQLAREINADTPSLPSLRKRELEALRDMNGADFDKAYVACMRALHAHDVSRFADQAQISKDQRVQQFCQQMLPKLQAHEQHVTQMAQAVGLSNPANSAQPAGSTMPPANPGQDSYGGHKDDNSGQNR